MLIGVRGEEAAVRVGFVEDRVQADAVHHCCPTSTRTATGEGRQVRGGVEPAAPGHRSDRLEQSRISAGFGEAGIAQEAVQVGEGVAYDGDREAPVHRST